MNTLEMMALPGVDVPTLKRRRKKVSVSIVVASVMLASVLLLVIVVPFLPSYEPMEQSLGEAQLRPFSDGHLLGTDSLGRDVLSRLALAGRVSILIAFAVVMINVTVGVILGMTAGYFGGKVDQVIMGLADLQLTLPFLLVLIAVIAAVGPSIPTLIIVLGLSSWVRHGRVTRVLASAMRDRDFVVAAVTHGASDLRIIFRHLLPAIVPQLLVIAVFDIGVMITAEASLSFLGLGVQLPTPSWGGMIAEGQRLIQINPSLCIVPGITVFLLLGGLAVLGQHFSEGGTRMSGSLYRRDRK